MARLAKIGWQGGTKGNGTRGMRGCVTEQTATLPHRRIVRLMTIGTSHGFSMALMTTAAVLFGMLVAGSGEYLNHFSMTILTSALPRIGL